jgi:hypothetical protein
MEWVRPPRLVNMNSVDRLLAQISSARSHTPPE